LVNVPIVPSVVLWAATSATLVERLTLLLTVLTPLSLRSVEVSLVLLLAGAWGYIILGTWPLNSKHHLLNDIGDLVHAMGLKWAFTSFRKMALEVLFVFVVFIFEVTILLDLVVVDEEQFVVDHQAVVVLSSLGLVWSLETNEGVGTFAVPSFENSAGLDFAERLENTSKLALSFILKAFHVQVASLLGRLVLEGFVLELFLAAFLAKGFADIQDLTPVVFAVEFSDGSESTTRTVLSILSIR